LDGSLLIVEEALKGEILNHESGIMGCVSHTTDYSEYKRAWERRWREEEERRRQLLREARKAAQECARLLVEEFGARRVYLFGSLLRECSFHLHSDIDLAVEGLGPGRVYWKALTRLWKLLPPGVSLDLIPMEDAYPSLVKRIKTEGKILYER